MPQSGTGKGMQKREAAFRKSERVEQLSMMLGPAGCSTGCTDLGCCLLAVSCLGTDSICLAANSLFNDQKLLS